MISYRTVGDILERLEELHGMPVQVEGVLTTSRSGVGGGYELLQYPGTERPKLSDPQQFKLWLEFGTGSIKPNNTVLTRWIDKRVRVHGIACRPKCLLNPAVECSMSDPSCWQAHLEVYSVQRVTSEQRRQRGA
jgi:hypothetical protein